MNVKISNSNKSDPCIDYRMETPPHVLSHAHYYMWRAYCGDNINITLTNTKQQWHN
nr:MAG TPA: hypothetical protein [Crassvirales sp.]